MTELLTVLIWILKIYLGFGLGIFLLLWIKKRKSMLESYKKYSLYEMLAVTIISFAILPVATVYLWCHMLVSKYVTGELYPSYIEEHFPSDQP